MDSIRDVVSGALVSRLSDKGYETVCYSEFGAMVLAVEVAMVEAGLWQLEARDRVPDDWRVPGYPLRVVDGGLDGLDPVRVVVEDDEGRRAEFGVVLADFRGLSQEERRRVAKRADQVYASFQLFKACD